MAKGFGRNGELWSRVVDPGFVMDCARASARGKRRRRDVAEFLFELEPRCFTLAEDLANGAWRPSPYRTFWIHDPKRRLISAAPFADRVVHRALVTTMEPFFERRFSPFSFACRRGKGTHRALLRAHELAQRFPFVLKGDIVKFFPSLDHEVCRREVRRVVADARFLEILERVIDGSNPQEPVVSWYPGDDLFSPLERRRGLPIGNLTSQFIANVVLDRLDHFVTDDLGFGAFVRYCDDFLVFGRTKSELWRLRDRIVSRLADLRLSLHARKGGVIGTGSPIPFLGFTLWRDRRRLQRHAVVRATRRLKRLRAAVKEGRIPASAMTASVHAWLGHLRHGHTMALRKRILARAELGAGE